MLRIILIDGESSVLDSLEKQIHDLSTYEVIGKYTNPHAGLIAIAQMKPEVVFIDINIKGSFGTDIAEQIMKAMPDIQIIFLANNDKYAIKAFELQVRDFVLKPLTTERIAKTIQKITIPKKANLTRYMIRCFKHFDFVKVTDEMEPIQIKWRTTKSKEILAYLLHNKDSEVRKDTLIKMHWPNADEKDAYARLYTTIYHIRSGLDKNKIPIEVTSSSKGYGLKYSNVLIDIEEFRKTVLNNSTIDEHNIKQHRKTLELYRGDYFEIENYEWAKNKQSRLHFLYVNYTRKIAEYYMTQKNYNEAIVMYGDLQKKLPYQEDHYFELMKLFQKIGDIDRVKDYYEKLNNAMQEIKKVPRDEINEWYDMHI